MSDCKRIQFSVMDSIIISGLPLSAWYTIVVVLAMFTILLKTKLSASVVFMGAVTALFIGGVVNIKEAFGGFSNSSVMVVAVLYVVIAGLSHTGVLQWIAHYLFGQPKNYARAIVRLMLPTAILSSVLSNVAVVTLFINVVKTWAKKLKISPSKLLIPLSYASGMGGVCTLIGTPPNLIISGMYAEETGIHLGIFTTTIVGLFCMAVGIISIIAMRKLIPERKAPSNTFENIDEYTVEMMVPTDNEYVGMSIKEAGFLNIKGGQLTEIIRFDRDVICPVADDEFIFGGDRLVFTGNIEDLLTLKKSHGLVTASNHVFSASELEKKRKMQTAYVTFSSSLIGKSLSDVNFEESHNVVLVAIARQGERIVNDLRNIVINAGDTLLIEGKKLKQEDFGNDLQFIDSENIPNTGWRTLFSALIMIAMVLLSAFKIMTLMESALVAAFAMLLTRCCSVDQAKKSIDWSIIMIFAASICLGNAMEKTGLATIIANGLLYVCGSNPYMALIGICLVATFITEFISNTACGALFYPIAMHAALSLGCNPLTFIVALMVSVSSSFATPIGSPTHMLVYAAGGYRFSDFLRIGIPMNLIILAANIFITTIIFPL